MNDGAPSVALGGALARSAHGVPRWWPTHVYYGWAMVVTLGVTAVMSYGVLSYAFAVFITPMGAELGWSKAQITGAFSVGQLVMGITAIPLGRWVDRHGARGVMTVGSLAASLLLIAWSRVQSVTAFYALWTLLGAVSAAVLYEPAFAVVATWFRRDRGRALTVLTFIGGFASVAFVPLTTWLVDRFGWRGALLWLAVIYATLTIAPHAFVLRRRPADLGLEPDGHTATSNESQAGTQLGHTHHGSVAAREAIRSRAFGWLTIAFALSAIATTTVTVHLVPLLLERGYAAGFAGAAMGVLGLMALPGRLVFTPLGDRWPRTTVTALIFGLGAAAIAILLVSGGALAVWVFVALFGAGFGAISPARAALVAETFGAGSYAAISGVLAFVLAVARAAAPVGASIVYAVSGGLPLAGYDAVLAVLLLFAVGAAVAVLGARVRPERSRL